MCGRFALISNPEKIKAQFHVEELPFIDPNYNTCPTEPILCLVASPDLGLKGDLPSNSWTPIFMQLMQMPLVFDSQGMNVVACDYKTLLCNRI